MKKCKSLIAFTLIVVMLASVLSGCDLLGTQEKLEALAGTWVYKCPDTEEQALVLLESIEAYDSEIALADLSSLYYGSAATFDLEKNYSFSVDEALTRQCVREFYEGYFDALYAGRATLNADYEMEFDAMTEAEFQQFYAELYGVSDFEALLELLTENAYDYTAFEEPFETGTFTIRGVNLMCTVTGSTTAEALSYSISGDQLTLTFSDAVQVYSKVN